MANLNTLDEVARLIVTAELVNQDFDNDPDKVFMQRRDTTKLFRVSRA